MAGRQLQEKEAKLFSAFFFCAGALHFVMPDFYAARVPTWVPEPRAVVLLAGAAEMIAGVAAGFQRTRRLACFGISAFLAVVVVTNIAFQLRGAPLWGWVRVVFLTSLCAWAVRNARASSRDGARSGSSV